MTDDELNELDKSDRTNIPTQERIEELAGYTGKEGYALARMVLRLQLQLKQKNSGKPTGS